MGTRLVCKTAYVRCTILGTEVMDKAALLSAYGWPYSMRHEAKYSLVIDEMRSLAEVHCCLMTASGQTSISGMRFQ